MASQDLIHQLLTSLIADVTDTVIYNILRQKLLANNEPNQQCTECGKRCREYCKCLYLCIVCGGGNEDEWKGKERRGAEREMEEAVLNEGDELIISIGWKGWIKHPQIRATTIGNANHVKQAIHQA